MSSDFGKNIKTTIFGQSHSEAIGCTIDTLPAGEVIDLEELSRFMKRRAPGNSPLSTPRKEADAPEFLCGALPGKEENTLVTCGAPLTAIIRNTNVRSSDYSKMSDSPRPSHADFAARAAYAGYEDLRGGGHFSGRLTAPLCISGGIALQILRRRGIRIGAHIASVGNIKDASFDPVNVSPEVFDRLERSGIPALDPSAWEKMCALIEERRASLDSIGGVIECAVTGLEPGEGSPLTGSIESRLSLALFAVPAVKGVEFGSGFEGCSLPGSLNNDGFVINDGKIVTKTNNHGGILGGISSGMPVIFRTAIKATPSIAMAQNSVSYSRLEEVPLEIKGRHDPCILPRALPVIEAVAALTILDILSDPEKHI